MSIATKLNEFLDAFNISASSFAKAIGVSAATISQIRSENYKGDVKSVSEKIEKYINNFSKNSPNPIPKDEIYQSADLNTARYIIESAVNEREMALIYGMAGSGKTTILKEYEKSTPNAILIEATAHTNARALILFLIAKLKIETKGDLDARLRTLCAYLKNADKVILIDEAEHLPLRALEDLRRIHDFSGVALILCGTEVLLRNLIGKSEKFSQLYSRIGSKYVMEGLSKDECEKAFCKGIYEYTNGNFRSSAKLYKRAKSLANANKTTLNDQNAAQLIASASQMVILG